MKFFAFLLLILPYVTFAAGSLSQETFSNEAGSRQYSVYVPENLQSSAGLLVVLHGCLMTGQQMMDGTRLNKIADQKGFVVIYPEQTYQDNPMKCWNWFRPENQQRKTGESSLIVGMTQQTLQKYHLNSKKVFLAGLSAGSAMAANLLGCYADLFSGGLLESGLEFAAAQSEVEAHQIMQSGPSREIQEVASQAAACTPRPSSLLSVIVVHGARDPYVGTINADRTFQVFSELNSIFFIGSGGTQDQISQTKSSLPASNGHYSAQITETQFKGKTFVKEIMVEQMGHGWSGGQVTVPYMEPKGIDASQLIGDEFFR